MDTGKTALLCLASLFAFCLAACAAPGEARPGHPDDDGPYVTYTAQGLEARWLCNGEVLTRSFPSRQWPVRIEPRCAYPRTIEVRAPADAVPPDRIDGVARWVALSDVHGQYALMLRLLRAQGVVDDDGDWAFGSGHLVMTGDAFDRGPQVTEVFWHLYALEQQAREAGGGLHFLLGNHETMVLADDLRYLHEKYPRVAARLDTPFPALFGPRTVIGDWLRHRNTVMQVDAWLFLHGGLHPKFPELGLSLTETNRQFRRSLDLSRDQRKADPVLDALYGRDGPVWYRGYFEDSSLRAADLDALFQRLGVRGVVVGHTSMSGVMSWFDGRIYSIDSSMKEGESGELLRRENDAFQRGTLTGERLPVPAGVP